MRACSTLHPERYYPSARWLANARCEDRPCRPDVGIRAPNRQQYSAVSTHSTLHTAAWWGGQKLMIISARAVFIPIGRAIPLITYRLKISICPWRAWDCVGWWHDAMTKDHPGYVQTVELSSVHLIFVALKLRRSAHSPLAISKTHYPTLFIYGIIAYRTPCSEARSG